MRSRVVGLALNIGMLAVLAVTFPLAQPAATAEPSPRALRYLLACEQCEQGCVSVRPIAAGRPTQEELADEPPDARCVVYDLDACGPMGVVVRDGLPSGS